MMFFLSTVAVLASFTQSTAAGWREAEKGILADHVQLTFGDRFVKAGESYFSPDDSKIIFQAVETPAEGAKADEFYAMFVADVVRDGASKRITGLENIRPLSPKGSANTCGWFHPTDPNLVIFASTIGPPTQSNAPGYQRGTSRYKWAFPPETRIVQCDLRTADGTPGSLKTLVGDGKAYCAEGSLSADGRHLLYCSLESNEGDLFVRDLKTNKTTRLVQARGYDGGPFFSPDGKRICYRSDRLNDSLLQLFVAELAFNDQGEIVGIKSEHQLTDDLNVNWCPFWTHEGRHVVYATSEVGHLNYEVFMVDADPGDLPGSTGTIKYGTAKRRITNANEADVLPAFSRDGKWMIWTSKRGAEGESQLWTARFVLNVDAPWKPTSEEADRKPAENRLVIEDPQTGRIYVYDLTTHTLSEYDMKTHQLTEVTDPSEIQRVMELHEGKAGEQ